MERPFSINHIDHVVIRVRDVEQSIAFYTMLGGELRGKAPFGMAVQLTPHSSILLQGRPEYVPAELPVLDHICLAIAAPHIQGVMEYLRENDVEIIRGPSDTPAGPTVNVRDPDGNEIEIRIKG